MTLPEQPQSRLQLTSQKGDSGLKAVPAVTRDDFKLASAVA